MALHKCNFCEGSYTSKEQKEMHEKKCSKNNKPFKEKFKEIMKEKKT